MKSVFKFALFSSCIFVAGAAQAQEKTYPQFTIGGSLRAQALGEENNDLGTLGDEFQDSESLDAKIRATLDINQNTRAFTEVRGVLNYGDGGGEDPVTNEPLGQDHFAELRQLWIENRGIFGLPPLGVRFGRQRFSEPRSLWWNRDFDALRVSYDSTMFKGFLAAGQNMMSYRTGDDDFLEDDQDIFRVLAEGSWEYQYGHFVELRGAASHDHSGTEDVGTIIEDDDRDDEDGDLFWAGLRLKGSQLPAIADNNIKYHAEIMGVAGEADLQTSTAGPGANERTVTGNDDEDILGWAFDAGVEVPLPVYAEPSLILGYAFGSGDDGDGGTNNGFRQTGLHSNSNYIGLSDSAVNYYGFVLRPELSNIHIFTAGVSAPAFKASNMTLLYHYYRRSNDETDISSSGVNASLNGEDNDIGHGLDLSLNVNLTEEFGLPVKPFKGVHWRSMAGVFRAGEAYGEAEDENAFRARTELLFQF